jgi:hypothetical protein
MGFGSLEAMEVTMASSSWSTQMPMLETIRVPHKHWSSQSVYLRVQSSVAPPGHN